MNRSTGEDEAVADSPLWSTGMDRLLVSDRDILLDRLQGLDLKALEPLSPDTVYASLCEVRKASDGWIKYYMISVALLVMAALEVLQDVSIFGDKVKPAFFTPVTLFYFCVCTCAYTNFELKVRLFRLFFEELKGKAVGPRSTEVLLRYPLAFYGAAYLPHEMRSPRFVFGTRHVLGTLPAAAVLIAAYVLTVFGLMALLFYDLALTAASADLPLPVKIATFVAFLGTMTVSAQSLRKPTRQFKYEIKPAGRDR